MKENKHLPVSTKRDKGFVRNSLHGAAYGAGILLGTAYWSLNLIMPERWEADIEEAASAKEAFKKGRQRAEDALDDLLEGII
jgi:hypothetical protein